MENSISIVPVQGDGMDDDLNFLANASKGDDTINVASSPTGNDQNISINIQDINTLQSGSGGSGSGGASLVVADINSGGDGIMDLNAPGGGGGASSPGMINIPSSPTFGSAPTIPPAGGGGDGSNGQTKGISLSNSFQVLPELGGGGGNSGVSSNTSGVIPQVPPISSSPVPQNTGSNTGGGFSMFSGAKSNEEVAKTAKDIMREKMYYLNKFEQLRQKGIKVMKHFDSTSNLDDMKMEYERLKSARDMQNSIKFQRRMMMMFVTGTEYLNTKFDPFDVDLDGWSESVHENLEDYDDIFEDLYEKYKDRAKMAPELRLMFALGGSAFMFHITNRMFRQSVPGMADIARQNPDLAKNMAGGGGGGRSRGGGGGGMGGFSMPGMPGLSNLMGLFGDGGGGGDDNQSAGSAEERENFQGTRPEMKGPSDMDAILASLERQNGNSANNRVENVSVVSESAAPGSLNIQMN
jgi:hypothetical protein